MSASDEREDVWAPVTRAAPHVADWTGYTDVEDDDEVVADLPSAWVRLERWVRAAIEEERAVGTPFLLVPIAFALGAIFYFLTPREPNLAATALVGLLGAGLCLASIRRRLPYAALVGTLLLGFAAGKARTEGLSTPVVERVRIARVVGTVGWTERRADGSVRYTIELDEGGSGVERVRVVHRKPNLILRPGQGVAARLRLMPPPGPVVPGGYDFSFFGWFQGRGAVGTVLGPVEPREAGAHDWRLIVSRWRYVIGERITDGMDERTAPLARALIIGDRAGIDEDVAEDLRLSGLAHILAISGLHMMLVTGLIFVSLRKAAAMLSVGSLRLPVKKAAAIGAFFFATAYLALSGMNLSTQRAYVMVVIMLAAVLLDRRAATLRNVAIAALAVLAWQPEAIFAPGFQMSFAAATALVSTYGFVLRWQQRREAERKGGWVRSSAAWIGGLSLTSLVAGFATAPFAAYHFHRIALLSLLANLAAMPVVTFAVMPLAVLSVLAMPFGMDALVLPLLGWSLEAVAFVAAEVASWGAVSRTGLVSPIAFALGACAFCALTLLRTALRWLGLVPACFAMLVPSVDEGIVAVIAESGRNVTVVAADRLAHSSGRPDGFANGIAAESFPRPSAPERFRCDRLGCAYASQGMTFAMSKREESLRDDCDRADLIVVRYRASCPPGSASSVVDRSVLAKRGSATVALDHDGAFRFRFAYAPFPRPWTRHRFTD